MGKPFSPLFIGEDSSIVKTNARPDAVPIFQSPLHRGRLFNRLRGNTKVAEYVPFSPLFIGEDSSMPSRTPPSARSTAFQSPLHRGRLFNYRSRSRPRERGHFQSPLHRGRLFNAACFPRGHCSHFLSVPSSSGKTLQ